MSVEASIKALERQIDRVKLLNRLGKVPPQKAKFQIKELEIYLSLKINELPKYERSIYKIKKEFGKEF